MTSLFADTSFFVAFLNPRDEYHDLAVGYMSHKSDSLVTTAWVLVELGNFLSKSRTRRRFAPFVRDLRADPLIEIVAPGADFFEQALNLYGSAAGQAVVHDGLHLIPCHAGAPPHAGSNHGSSLRAGGVQDPVEVTESRPDTHRGCGTLPLKTAFFSPNAKLLSPAAATARYNRNTIGIV
jgi:hypothetical protein